MNKPIFGYINHELHKKVRLVDFELKEVVIWVFERIAEGATPWQVAKELGVRYPGRRPGVGKGSNREIVPIDIDPYDVAARNAGARPLPDGLLPPSAIDCARHLAVEGREALPILKRRLAGRLCWGVVVADRNAGPSGFDKPFPHLARRQTGNA